jgi:hypothetical protein
MDILATNVDNLETHIDNVKRVCRVARCFLRTVDVECVAKLSGGHEIPSPHGGLGQLVGTERPSEDVRRRDDGICLMAVQQNRVTFLAVSDGDGEAQTALDLDVGGRYQHVEHTGRKRASRACDKCNHPVGVTSSVEPDNIRRDGWWEEEGLADRSQAGNGRCQLNEIMHRVVDSGRLGKGGR